MRRLVVWRFKPRRIDLPGRHFELSVVAPLEEGSGSAAPDLLELGLRAARRASDVDLTALHERSDTARHYLSLFPGEHYRLLAALISCLEAKLVTEIGTYTGLSALTMLTSLDADARLVTFDVIPWEQIAGTALRADDFASGRLEQRIGDLSDPEVYARHRVLLADSDMIFVDGPKDGRFESDFIRLLLSTPRTKRALLVFDDIRLWNMLRVWAELDLPKLDLTSFGHWSGTGICWLGA
jgi:predicted O-methyltransferase YrrM